MQSGASGIASVFSTCILVGRGESAGWKLPWPVCRGAVGPRGRQQLCLTVAGTQQAVPIRVSAADTGLSFSCCGLSIFSLCCSVPAWMEAAGSLPWRPHAAASPGQAICPLGCTFHLCALASSCLCAVVASIPGALLEKCGHYSLNPQP